MYLLYNDLYTQISFSNKIILKNKLYLLTNIIDKKRVVENILKYDYIKILKYILSNSNFNKKYKFLFKIKISNAYMINIKIFCNNICVSVINNFTLSEKILICLILNKFSNSEIFLNDLLRYSCIFNYYKLTKILIKQIKIIYKYKLYISINCAITNNFDKILNLLLKYVLKNKVIDITIIDILIKNNKVNSIKKYIITKNCILTNEHKIRLLKWSLRNNYMDLFYKIIKIYNIDLNKCDYLFIIAIRINNLKIMKILYNNIKIDKNILNDSFKLACIYGYSKIVEILLKNKDINPDIEDNKMLQLASKNGDLQIVKLLLNDKQIDPNTNDNYPLMIASEKGYLEIVKILIKDSRINIDYNNNYAIEQAALNGHFKIVELLLKESKSDIININYYTFKPIYDKYKNILKLLINNCKINIDNRSICMLLTFDNVKLIRHKIKDEYIYKWLIKNDRILCIIDIINKNIDIGFINYNEILLFACKNNNKELVELLFKQNLIDVKWGNINFLKIIVINNYLDLLKIILNFPIIDPNIEDQCIVKLAYLHKHKEMLTFIIQHEKIHFEKIDTNIINWIFSS